MAVVEITAGSQGSTTASWAPYNTYYHDNRCQFVVLASELQAAGLTPNCKIYSLFLHCYTRPGRDLANFRIRLQNTAQTTSTAWVTSGWTLVYGPVNISRTLLTAGTWYEHVFNTPFTWNGQNLLIDISRDDSAYTSGGGNYIRTGLTSRMYARYSDSGYTWPFDGMSGTVYNYILEIRLRIPDREDVETTVSSTGLLRDIQKYIEALLTFIISASKPSDSPLSEAAGIISLVDRQEYNPCFLLSEVFGTGNVADKQKYLELLLTEAPSSSSVYLRSFERLLTEVVSSSSVYLRSFEQLLTAMGSASNVTDQKRATAIVLSYLLSVADRLDYKLSVRDMAEFKFKVADLLEYVLKMRD